VLTWGSGVARGVGAGAGDGAGSIDGDSSGFRLGAGVAVGVAMGDGASGVEDDDDGATTARAVAGGRDDDGATLGVMGLHAATTSPARIANRRVQSRHDDGCLDAPSMLVPLGCWLAGRSAGTGDAFDQRPVTSAGDP
jgi:hypothetical protein